MLEGILSLLGKPFVLPASFLLIGAWALNKLIALHDSKRRNRIEFLEQWQSIDKMDDVRLEVTVRHLIGTYLPADIIRTVYRMPFPTQSLLDLAAIWPLIEFDQMTRILKWKKPGYGDVKGRLQYRTIFLFGYIAFALGAFIFLYSAVGSDPSKPSAWISGINTVMLFGFATGCIARFGMLDDVGKGGDKLVSIFNAARHAEILSESKHRKLGASEEPNEGSFGCES